MSADAGAVSECRYESRCESDVRVVGEDDVGDAWVIAWIGERRWM